MLVHCSAGIGRTGTFLAICLMTEAVKELQKLKRDKQRLQSEELKSEEGSGDAARQGAVE